MGEKEELQKREARQSADDGGESRRNFLKRLPYITPVVLTFQLGEEAHAKNKGKER
jgi:hypothetical protein